MASRGGIKRERLIRIGRKKRRFSSFTIPFFPPFHLSVISLGHFWRLQHRTREKEKRYKGIRIGVSDIVISTNRKISSVVLAFILVRGRHQSPSDWSTIRDTLKSLALAH
ncbi:uncharacterized protein B0T23DRAFT_170336 [Neurospora hispaniola]|uniref:Uncharacterized protein n=1 Tax=Neurospora hispaniola TaxID=588809 RepID=A0AAJ0I5U8_9PEZI|nr:hypothetical protein B0T23DRAFT_170336 [Neurospora hispaniola]